MLRNKNEIGITLVALVITIIIIIILATVTINFAFGENGLIKRAEQASEFYANDTKYTEDSVANVEKYLDGMLPGGSGDGEDPTDPPTPTKPTTVVDAKPEEGEEAYVFEETTEIKDALDNPVWIPGGFHIASDSGTKVEEGIVIEDNTENHNQFVWIPVGEYKATDIESTENPKPIITKTNELTRRQWGKTTNVEQIPTPITGDEVADGNDGEFYYGEGATQDKYGSPITPVETNIDAFKTSATNRGGFYIGRYEAGTEEERTSKSDPLTTPIVQENKHPYVYVTRGEAKELAESMYSGNTDIKATTELISSYAWDTALNFICQTNIDGYKLATTTDKTKANIDTDNKTQTGAYTVDGKPSDKYSNIHDFLGNCLEWTTEYSSYSYSYSDGSVIYPGVDRGGSYLHSTAYAAVRSYGNTIGSYNYHGFRSQLYVK